MTNTGEPPSESDEEREDSDGSAEVTAEDAPSGAVDVAKPDESDGVPADPPDEPPAERAGESETAESDGESDDDSTPLTASRSPDAAGQTSTVDVAVEDGDAMSGDGTVDPADHDTDAEPDRSGTQPPPAAGPGGSLEAAFDFDGELPASVDRAAVRRMAVVAALMDESIRVPGTDYRIGIDPLLGVVPGAGDTLSAGLSLYIVLESARLGVSYTTLLSMLATISVDAVGGTIPVVGDLFDAVWKANKWNVELAMEDLAAADST